MTRPPVPRKVPLILGLAAALADLGLVLFWPPGVPWRDGLSAALLIVVALSLAWYERQMARRGHLLAPVRWVALALVVIALAQAAWLLRR